MIAATVNNYNYKIHPQKLALWFGIASMIMLFAGTTSAYLVRRAAPNWEAFNLPDVFWASTLLVILSSISIEAAKAAFKRSRKNLYKLFLAVTVILGAAFAYSQYMGWQELSNMGIYLDGNPSGSFLYLLTGMHLFHLVGGLFFLLIIFFITLLKYRGEIGTLLFETDPDKKLKLELMATYWHFVDVLWVYLFIFFLINHL